MIMKLWSAGSITSFPPALIVRTVRASRRQLQLTPMKHVLSELRKRGVAINDLVALEVFGCSGESHVKDYASSVSSLEVWEIDPQFETHLKKHFPKATIKITDSYQEVKRRDQRYDLIVIDNGTSMRTGGYCEHFDLFPDIFRLAKDPCVLIVNVIPKIDDEVAKIYPYLFNQQQLARRRLFYKTARPQEVPFDQIVRTYQECAKAENFKLDWHFLQQRNFVYYLVLHISKMSVGLSNPRL